MPYCDCGNYIQSGSQCSPCSIEDSFEGIDLDEPREEETDEEWAVQQQGLDGESHTGQATIDGGVVKDGDA